MHTVQVHKTTKAGIPNLCLKLVAKLIAIPIVILVRLLRPIVVIRFGMLRSENIGHFAANTELYLCERDIGLHGRRVYDFFSHRMPICNQQLAKMWARLLHISPVYRYFDRASRRLPGWKKHWIPVFARGDVDVKNLIISTKTHLNFTPEEEKIGLQKLCDLGVKLPAEFVCFYARDSVYSSNTALKSKKPLKRHDYRNSSIDNYIPAMQEVAKRNYYALRIGAMVQKPVSMDNEKIIDYATIARDEFMDIFLCAKCKFFVGSTGGINAVPRIFRRPMVYVNFVPLRVMHLFACAQKSLILPKKLWLRKEKRFLTFNEALKTGATKFWLSQQYEQAGLDVVENDADEILAAAIEMDERLNDSWVGTSEDIQLQQRFWEIFVPDNTQRPNLETSAEYLYENRHWTEYEDEAAGKPNVNISSYFLRQNRYLLD